MLPAATHDALEGARKHSSPSSCQGEHAMSLVDFVQRPLVVRQVAIWALEIARRCHPDVSIRLGQNIYRMSLSEARGYVRARCAAVLDDEIAQLVKQTRCHPEMAAAVSRRAVVEITRLAIGD